MTAYILRRLLLMIPTLIGVAVLVFFLLRVVPGDIVEVKNTGGPPLSLEQNGDWSVPWNEWRKGSALNA